MTRKDSPFHERKYTYDKTKKCYFPILEISVGHGKFKKKVSALVDTGCTPSVYLCKAYVEKKGIILGKKINREPHKVSVADGHKINADFYVVSLEINGKEEEVVVCVTDPVKFFEEEELEIEIVEPLLGRGVLDNYDIMFKGKKKKILLFHPE